MSKLQQAVREIHIADDTDNLYMKKGGIHPLSRLIVTFIYLLVVISFPQYDVSGLAGMVLYLIIHYIWYEVSGKDMVKRIWPVFVLLAMVGIANPLLDREIYASYGNMTITCGMVSMLTLMLKGIFCVTASYLLVVKTGIGQICYALQCIHLPKEIITMLLLMHRYMLVLMKEVERMQQAYKLRAPGQKGLHIRAWGSFVGLLLLRSIDRAEEVFESMQLRGYNGNIYVSFGKSNGSSIVYGILWSLVILMLRMFPVFHIVGMWF